MIEIARYLEQNSGWQTHPTSPVFLSKLCEAEANLEFDAGCPRCWPTFYSRSPKLDLTRRLSYLPDQNASPPIVSMFAERPTLSILTSNWHAIDLPNPV